MTTRAGNASGAVRTDKHTNRSPSDAIECVSLAVVVLLVSRTAMYRQSGGSLVDDGDGHVAKCG
jgi:hypothetical protein